MKSLICEDRLWISDNRVTFINNFNLFKNNIDKMFSENNYNYTDYHDDASDENK